MGKAFTRTCGLSASSVLQRDCTLGLPTDGGGVGYLALQIGQVHAVVVGDGDLPHPGTGQVHGSR